MLTLGPVPWLVDLRGLVFGAPLNDQTRDRLRLAPDAPDELDDLTDARWWSGPDRNIAVATCDGVVALVNFRDTVRLGDVELIGAMPASVLSFLGDPANNDDDDDYSILFRVGPWELTVGLDPFDQQRISWIAISNDDLLI